MAKKSIAKNYIYNLIYQMLTIVLPLVTTPYLSRVLGAEAIGVYGYTLSIVTYFILFGSLGIAMYGQREIAYVQDEKEKQSKTFWEIVLFRIITMSIALIVFYFTFCLKGEYSIYYKILIMELIANAIDISWYFQGIEDFGKTVVRNTVVKTLSLICIFIFIKTPSDLWKYFLIYTVANVLGNFTMWMYIPKMLNKVRLKELKLKKHIKPTISLFIPQVAVQIYAVLDKTMVGNLTGSMSEVGYYEQAQKLVKTMMMIVTALGSVMISRVSNLYINNQKEEIDKSLNTSFNCTWFLGFPIMFGMIAISRKFVPIFYGGGYEAVIPILIATSPILLINGLNSITGNQYLIPIGKQKIYTITVIVGAITNVILNLILINVIGTIGAAIASVFAETVILVLQLYYLRKEINFIEKLKSVPKCFVSSIVMFIVVILIDKYTPCTLKYCSLEITIGIIIYILLLFIMKYEFLNNIINQIKVKFKRRIENE